MLAVADGEEGAKLVEQLGQTFHVPVPPSKWHEPLELLQILWVSTFRPGALGFDEGPSEAGLLRQTPSILLEYDLAQKKGAIKASRAADLFVADLASRLRDGPRPLRTPASDPQVSAVGPKLEDGRDFGGPKATFMAFRDGSSRILYNEDEPSRLMETTVADPAKSWELIRFPKGFRIIDCPDFLSACFSVGYESPDVFWTDRTKRTTKKLTGPWKGNVDAPMGTEAVAPDGSFVVVSDDKGLYFVPTSGSGPVQTFAGRASFDGWTGHGLLLRAIVEKERHAFAVDPRTGESAPTTDTIPPTDSRLSPDKKHRAECKDGVITITDLDTKATRSFTAFEEDKGSNSADFCGNWRSPRYLEYSAARHAAVLDIDTMKVAFVLGPDGKSPPSVDFSPDLTWAVVGTEKGLRLYRVTIR
jgi:hypothetical protein